LLQEPESLYVQAPDPCRRLLNQTFFEQLFVDDGTVTEQRLNQPFDDWGWAARRYRRVTQQGHPAQAAEATRDEYTVEQGSVADLLAAVALGNGSNKTAMVEHRGVEPLTSAMRTQRSTS
jgi:site-specific DNA recombinase